MIRIGAAIAALLALAASPAASAEQDTQLWTTAIASGPVAGDLAAWVEVQTRIGDDVSRLRQSKVRIALGYRTSDALTLYGGYALVTSRRQGDPDLTEHRLWQQASYTVATLEALRLTGRTRLEQRSFEGSNDTGWRLRQQLRLALPLTPGRGPTLVSSVEVLMALNDTGWGADKGLDQIRGFAGVNLPIGAKQAIELGYLNQYVRRIGASDQMNHVGVLAFAHRF